ncbi:MAG: YbjQ family protein [Vampirovibrionales bacterium]
MIQPQQVTTDPSLECYEVIKNLGVVHGLVVRSRSIVGDFFGQIQQMFGGNITIYQRLCEHAREDAYNKLLAHAESLGANAITGLRYDTNEVWPGVTEVFCYGTACVVKKESLD